MVSGSSTSSPLRAIPALVLAPPSHQRRRQEKSAGNPLLETLQALLRVETACSSSWITLSRWSRLRLLVADLLKAAPRLMVLVTSRSGPAPVQLSTSFLVTPLALPRSNSPAAAARRARPVRELWRSSSSVRSAVKPETLQARRTRTPQPSQRSALASTGCRSPLNLQQPVVKLFPPAGACLARLARRLQVARRRSARPADPRHQTLRADDRLEANRCWSPTSRSSSRGWPCLRGRWTLDAAEAVCHVGSEIFRDWRAWLGLTVAG